MLLTQLDPVRFTGVWQGFEVGDRLAGAAFSLGGRRYESGLAAFAGSEIEFDLKGLYHTFTALAGMDASSEDQSAAAGFVVIGDGHELWRSGPLGKNDAPKVVKVSIVGIHKLILRATGTSEGGNRSQADWAEPSVAK